MSVTDIQNLLDQGVSVDEVRRQFQASKQKATIPQKETQSAVSTMWNNTKQSFQQRQQNYVAGYTRQIAGQQTGAETALQALGQGAGFATDIIGSGLSLLTPEPVKNVLGSVVQKALGTDAAKKVIDDYSTWAKNNPRAASGLESVINITSILPIGAGAKTAGGVVAKGALSKTGEKLITSAEKTAVGTKQSFVRSLVRPEQTKAVREEQVARSKEIGTGILKRTEITPSATELNAEQSIIKNVPNINAKNSYQKNFNLIKDRASELGEELAVKVKQNDVSIPRDTSKQKLLDVQNYLSTVPTITGDAETTAKRLIIEANKLLDKYGENASGVLQARKDYDEWVLSLKRNAFDAKTENAFTIANDQIRSALNNIVIDNVKDVNVKQSLREQFGLYTALNNIKTKAAIEADSAIGRFFQASSKILGTKNKAVQALAAVVGIGGLGAASTFAPAASIIGIGGFLTYKAGKLLLSPQVKSALGRTLKEIDRKLPTIKDATQKNQLLLEVSLIKSMLNDERLVSGNK